MVKSFRRLANRKARQAYVNAELVNGVAHQIRVLRQQRNWTQSDLAKRLKTSQTVVCRLEDPSYGKFSVKTLLEVGKAFDVALYVRYMAFSEFMLKTWDTSPSRFEALSYEQELGRVGSFSVVEGSLPYMGALGPLSQSSGHQVVATVSSPQGALPLFIPVTSPSAMRPTLFGLTRNSREVNHHE